ncbi:hypothetical protein DOY81_006852 [Sarcophaga bullata]|nr:hypothetical protein DOY81_006852 [Sarcophaga bullata]
MNFKLILFQIILLAYFTSCRAVAAGKDVNSEGTQSYDLLPSETNAKLFNLGSLFGYNYPNPNRYPTKYPAVYPGGYYPNNNYYPPTTNVLGGGGYGGYGGYGGNGGLRQYYGYWDPNYVGQRNRGYGYYQHSNTYGFV